MSYRYSGQVNAYLMTERAGSLTGAQRTILLTLAHRASDIGKYAGMAWDSPGWDLARIAGVKYLGQALGGLAKLGLECRVQHGTDSRGRPIYAHKGRKITYRLPDAIINMRIKGESTDSPNESTDSPNESTDSPFKVLEVLEVQEITPPTPRSPFDDPPRPTTPNKIKEGGGDPMETGNDQNRTDEQTGTINVFVDHLRAMVPTLTAADVRRLTSTIGAALDRGVTITQVADSIGSNSLDGANNPRAVVESRIRALVPLRPVQQAQPRCPVHHAEPWNTCRSCKGDLMAGDDPYQGQEHLRPVGWIQAYGKRAQLIVGSMAA